jgi:hypothetical protein
MSYIILFDLFNLETNLKLAELFEISKPYIIMEELPKNLDYTRLLSRYPHIQHDLSLEFYEHLIEMKSLEREFYEIALRLYRSSPEKFKGFNGDFLSNEYYISIFNYTIKLIMNNSIENVLLWDTPHKPFEFMVFNVAKRLGKRVIVIKKLPNLIDNTFSRFFVSDDYPSPDVRYMESFNKTESLSNDEILQLLEKDMLHTYHELFETSLTNKTYNPINLGHKWDGKDIIKYSMSRLLHTKKHFKTIILGLRFVFKRNIYNLIYKKVLFRFVSRLEKNDIPQKYIYYPLHYQPEATTNVFSKGFFHDQLELIKLISKTLRDGNLLVREHPTYFYRWSNESVQPHRNFNFYKELMQLPNVILISHNVNHYNLISNAEKIVTVNGSVCFEALALGKNVLYFGDFLYSLFPNTYFPKSKVDLESFLNDYEFVFDRKRLYLRTMYALQELSFSLDIIWPVNKMDMIGPLKDFIDRNYKV